MQSIKVGDRVLRNEPYATEVGTVMRLIGKQTLGGGIHAKVRWDSGHVSNVKLGLLKKSI